MKLQSNSIGKNDMLSNEPEGPEWSRVETITPERAKLLLETRAHNRPLKPDKKIETALLEKRFSVNGAQIVISNKGRLLDGQHRLLECVRTGISFRSFVAYEVDESCMPTIDTGRPRSLFDGVEIAYPDINLESIGDKGTIKSYARIAYKFDCSQTINPLMGPKPDNSLCVDYFQRNFHELLAAKQYTNMCEEFLPKSITGFMTILFNRIDKDACQIFFHDLSKGANLPERDPLLQLRTALNKLARRKQHMDHVFLCVAAWNMRRRGNRNAISVHVKYLRDEGGFPHIEK